MMLVAADLAQQLETPSEEARDLQRHEPKEWQRWPWVLALTAASNISVRAAERRAWDVASTQTAQTEEARLAAHNAIVDIIPHDGEWKGIAVSDFASFGLAAYFIVRLSLTRCGQSNLLVAIRRLLTHFGLTLFFRALVLFVTVYPDSETKCYEHIGEKSSWLVVLTPVFLPIATCGDMMPSGHTLFYCAISLFQHITWPEVWLVGIVGTLGAVSLSIERIHWSADVVVSFFVSALLWLLCARVRSEGTWASRALRLLTGPNEI